MAMWTTLCTYPPFFGCQWHGLQRSLTVACMQDDNTQRDSMTDQIAHFPQTALRTTADDKFGIPHDYLRQSLEDTKQHTAQQCADFSARLYKSRNLVFTCITALKLSAVELPWCNLPQDEFHILASSDNKRSHVSSARFMVWTHSIEAMQSITIDDRKIWFTDPITTWAIMAKFLSQDEVIVLADAICRAKPQGIPLQKQDFTDYLTMDERFIGKRKCRDALPFIGTPLDSSMEMRCVIALLRFGLPHPETGYPIVITALNRTVHVDMAYPEFHVIMSTTETPIVSTKHSTAGTNASEKPSEQWDTQSSWYSRIRSQANNIPVNSLKTLHKPWAWTFPASRWNRIQRCSTTSCSPKTGFDREDAEPEKGANSPWGKGCLSFRLINTPGLCGL